MITSSPRTFAAFTLPDGRRAGLCTEDKPRCVHGHHVKTNVELTTDAVVHCAYRSPRAGVDQCNARLYAALLHFGSSAVVRDQGTRLWIVIEISADQARQITRVPMTVMEKLIYLNATLPGVDVDILQQAQRELRR